MYEAIGLSVGMSTPSSLTLQHAWQKGKTVALHMCIFSKPVGLLWGHEL